MSQYKLLAAYAMGLIADESKFIQLPYASYGVRKNGEQNPIDELDAKQLTLIGAVRMAQYRFDASYTIYNNLSKEVYSLSRRKYQLYPRDLNHKQALSILLSIAKS